MTYGTSSYALKNRANLQPGETLIVLAAAGGVGLAAVELDKAMNAGVVAATSSNEKVTVAKVPNYYLMSAGPRQPCVWRSRIRPLPQPQLDRARLR